VYTLYLYKTNASQYKYKVHVSSNVFKVGVILEWCPKLVDM